MRVIIEERLRFEFGPSWQQVEKYDDHAIHQKGIGCLQGRFACKDENCCGEFICTKCGKEPGHGSKAVDILGSPEGKAYFIEIKDFRGHRIENKKRVQNDLAIEVALKVRDSLAGLVGALHKPDSESWHMRAASIFKTKPKVILWLEADNDSRMSRKQGHSGPTLVDKLGKKLEWLNPDIIVQSQHESRGAPDLKVSNLSDGVVGLRKLMKMELSKKPQGSISRDDFFGVMGVPKQVAGEKLASFVRNGFLAVAPDDTDRFTVGTKWDQIREE